LRAAAIGRRARVLACRLRAFDIRSQQTQKSPQGANPAGNEKAPAVPGLNIRTS
jgi:hypothetical protein